MDQQEVRASFSLASVFSIRLLGLFMIYPVFATYAQHLHGATPLKIGLALGIYGLSQGLLQIPFGMMSDRVGRKMMVMIGLTLFALGSAVAAVSTSIEGVIVGRALQGTGAVGSVVLALVGDLTQEENRTKAMAVVGISIGASFMIALVAGPIAAGWVGVSGIFWFMVVLAAIGMGITAWVVPTPQRITIHRDAETVPAMLGSVLRNQELLRLDFGIFALHGILTASFLVVPHILRSAFSLSASEQWMIYLPVLLGSVAFMVPAVVVAEKYRHMKGVFVAAVGVLAASQAVQYIETRSAIVSLFAIVIFFAAFNTLEAILPSLVTKTAPPDAKGTATGVYSSSQFLGIFFGGAIGGWTHQQFGLVGVFAFATCLALAWLAFAATMARPGHYVTRIARLGDVDAAAIGDLAARLRGLPGVVDAVLVPEERMAYLKVDSKVFNAEAVAEVTGVK